MRSLFFKIFVWFWIASILVGGVQFLTAMWTSYPPLRDRFRIMSDRLCSGVGREAVESLDRDGKSGLDRYLANLKETTDIQIFLFAEGKPVLPGQKIPPEAGEMVRRQGGPEAMDFLPPHPPGPFLIAKPILGTGGKSYLAVMEMLPPPSQLNHLASNPETLVLRLGAVILMAGVVCYGLARYLTSPLRRLRLATRQLANGDLSVRIGRTMGKRRDEKGRSKQGWGTTGLVLGDIVLNYPGSCPLLSMLPPVIHVKGEKGAPAPWLTDILPGIIRETASPQSGSVTIINRLVHVLFIQAIRAYVATLSGTRDDKLSALLDPGIGPILRLLHHHPEKNWTVATLAEKACMSRSAFAARFTDLVGHPPLSYLFLCRMNKACHLLHDPQKGIKEIAPRVGYASEAAFSNAFKRWAGTSPGNYRFTCRRR